MADDRLSPSEARFAELLWRHQPLGSGELVRLCARELGWKKSTTYTVLKKLCEKGLFQNRQAVVSACISREAFEARQSRRFVEDTFGGSLPRFLAAFIGKGRLSARQVEELRRLIDEHGEE
ncbi:MAG: BlaI/MecI/CopY family transcriptional regulator [Clostridiales bacterium]|nr:BlaI/MecI/CopY family transcriptional regulator [Clostridiales bacterium]